MCVKQVQTKQVKRYKSKPPSSRGLGHLPFTEATGIRIPLGVYSKGGLTALFFLWKKSLWLSGVLFFSFLVLFRG